MYPSVLRRPRPARRRVSNLRPLDPDSTSPSFAPRRRATADFTEGDEEDEDEEEEDDEEDDDDEHDNREEELNGRRTARFRDENDDDDAEDEEGEEDGPSALPVLPLFSSTHLDVLPVYSITHSIRIIVTARTETSLSWEQLRSPQISQFLVKPMQQIIRQQHFNRATLYALMANSLQFTKEGQQFPANAGISKTRSQVCELLGLKFLKEYSTRELIDALAYDFYPLQGIPGAQPLDIVGSKAKNALTSSRSSTLEVAIRAQAKHFLAHPVVVQQLEAIWSGAITFYSTADTLHRPSTSIPQPTQAGGPARANSRTPLLGYAAHKEGQNITTPGRRTVMLYDPRGASILKLSRLRVPRYRSFLSTISLAVLIGLFLAVLIERSVQITGLELVFWFWSAGFMLDELVGFNEQGFALYIMSFWNVFDLGILALLIAYYCMRAYGVFVVDPHHWHDMAYDVLAANAILLLPRIFSVLDHYQYFSQLLIAFRLMAVDLIAVFTLVLIMCSGFFVFFTLSNNANDAADVAFKIFQLLMGFTPAAWDVWPSYNWLARGLLVLFLFICHFLIVTMLITVLTNSFVAISNNANEEHQFLFAINTISMVKNDALFSYVAPSNIFAWLLMPLRYFMPLKDFVWMNRVIIKVTHFPVLFGIYLYERFWLAPTVFEPTDLVDQPGRGRGRFHSSFADPANRTVVFSPGTRVREESVAGFHKDRALEEVFRRMPDPATLRTQRRHERHKTQTAIRNWMDQNDDDADDDGAGEPTSNWPTLDSRAIPEWQRRLSMGWERPTNLRNVSDIRSIASDPADLASAFGGSAAPPRHTRLSRLQVTPDNKDHQHTDADGDDELVTNDEDEEDHQTTEGRRSNLGTQDASIAEVEEEDYFTTPMSIRAKEEIIASSQGSSGKGVTTPQPRRKMHSRTMSTNTILYKPEDLKKSLSSSSASPGSRTQAPTKTSGRSSEAQTPGRRSSPRRTTYIGNAKPRPIAPLRGMTDNGAVSKTALRSMESRHQPRKRLSSVDMSILSDNTNLRFPGAEDHGAMAGSFQTQMAMAMMKDNQIRAGGGIDAGDRDRMGRLVLARMKTLEESFTEVIKEMRDMRKSSTAPTSRRGSSSEGSHQQPIIEVAGGSRYRRAKGTATPKKVAPRPASRKSNRVSKVDQPKRDEKGKGKEVAYPAEDEEDQGDKGEEEAEGGNSFLKLGSSL